MDAQKSILEESVKAAEANAISAEANAIAAKEGAKAANKNIEMFISKERARLKIDLKPLDLSKKQSVAYTVDFTLSNYGATAANIIETRCVTFNVPLNLVDVPELGEAIMFPMHSIPPPNYFPEYRALGTIRIPFYQRHGSH